MPRKVLWLLLLTFSLIGIAVCWSGWRATQVRSDLAAAQTLASSARQHLSAGDLTAAAAIWPELQRDSDRAAGRTSGPLWTLAEQVPGVGGTFRVVRRTALAAQLVGAGLQPVVQTASGLSQGDHFFRGGQVNLAAVGQLAAGVTKAARAAEQAQALLQQPAGWVPGAVRARVSQAGTAIAAVTGGLHAGERTLSLLPQMLGKTGPRRYFVAVQNGAEARATGGLIGAFAVITATDGKITLTQAGTDNDLTVAAAPVASDPGAARTWTEIGSTRAWFDANLTPHFPDVARNLTGQWSAAGGGALDGVLALDPLVMSELLGVTGPVTLGDGTTVTQANVREFVGHGEYVQYNDVAERKRVLATLATDLFHRVLAVPKPVPLLRAVMTAGRSGHLYLWSAHPAEQAALGEGLLSGALPTTDRPYLSVLSQNFGGNKLDQYVQRTVTVTGPVAGFLRVQVTLHNSAPLDLPTYMTVRSDRPAIPVPYGQAKVGLSVYGALSSQVGGVWVDGQPSPMRFDNDHGHRIGTLSVELPRGRDVTLVVLLSQPPGELTYRQQPLVSPDQLRIAVPHRIVGR